MMNVLSRRNAIPGATLSRLCGTKHRRAGRSTLRTGKLWSSILAENVRCHEPVGKCEKSLPSPKGFVNPHHVERWRLPTSFFAGIKSRSSEITKTSALGGVLPGQLPEQATHGPGIEAAHEAWSMEPGPNSSLIRGTRQGGMNAANWGWLVGLLFTLCFLTGVDKANISLASISMAMEFGWAETDKGFVGSAFLFGYTISQILGGLLLNRFGYHVVMAAALGGYMALSTVSPMAAHHSPHLLGAVRVMLGLFEGVTVPLLTGLVAQFIPEHMRSRVLSLIFSGGYLGLISAFLLCPSVMNLSGWSMLFYMLAGGSFLWCLGWHSWGPHDGTRDKGLQEVQSMATANQRPSGASLLAQPQRAAVAIGGPPGGRGGAQDAAAGGRQLAEEAGVGQARGGTVRLAPVGGAIGMRFRPVSGKSDAAALQRDVRWVDVLKRVPIQVRERRRREMEWAVEGAEQGECQQACRTKQRFGEAPKQGAEQARLSRDVPWGKLLGSRAVWAIMGAHVASNWGLYSILAWLPTFFSSHLGLDLSAASHATMVSWLGCFLAGNVSGWLADSLVNAGLPKTTVRKIVQGIAFGGPAILLSLIMSASTSTDAILIMTAALTLSSFSTGGFCSNHADLTPEHAGILFAITNTIGCIAGTISVSLTGVLLDKSGDWTSVWLGIAAVYVAGAVWYSLLADTTPLELERSTK